MTAPPHTLFTLTQSQLDTWVSQSRQVIPSGNLPQYIPLLAQADPDTVAIQVQLIDGFSLSSGNQEAVFPLMSVVKPLLLLFLLAHQGDRAVFARVGTQPSDQAFHSLAQLVADQGFPRNPMINSGALTLAGQLPGRDGTARCEALRQWLNQQAGCQLVLDQAMLASVRSRGNEANHHLAQRLEQAGYLEDINLTLDTYNQICCLSGTVVDLAQVGLLLAHPNPGLAVEPCIHPCHQQRVNALMLTCGLYEVSGHYAVQIGIPIKSGVSGAMLASLPGLGAIACYSPALDATGSSISGLFLLHQIAKTFDLSLFATQHPGR